MTSEEIKKECDKLYMLIRNSQKRIEELRDGCKHKVTYEGNYSYRIGQSSPATICYHCGRLIHYPE